MQTCAGSDFDYGTNNFKSSSGARRGIHAASRNTQRNLILNRFRNSAAKTPSVGLEQLFPVVTRNGSGEGCLDATLNDCLRGSYAHAPAAPDHTTTTTINAMDSLTPKIIPSKIPNSETGKVDTLAPESDRAGRGGLMRVEGRHHLVDIHGLAVFLRRSTRCLSCRAAFCLYVTGTISAQLAAVTQVKITCQKCHYTTSQTLSRPSSAPDEPCAQPSPSVSAPPSTPGAPTHPPRRTPSQAPPPNRH